MNAFANMSTLDQVLLVMGHLSSMAGFLFALMLLGRWSSEHRHPGSTIAWLLAIIFVPYIGIPFYLLLGGRKMEQRASKKSDLQIPAPDEPPVLEPGSAASAVLLMGGLAPVTAGNRIVMLEDGTHAWNRILDLIAGAKKSIHITTFILSNDAVGREFIEALARRAREGVEVRLLLDALGSWTTKGRFTKPLRDAGGKVGVFMPVLPFHRKWSANLRNHRKIMLFDENIAIIGGRNVGAEYLGHGADPKRWIDFSLLLEGPAVLPIRDVFAADWEFATDEPAAMLMHRTKYDDFGRPGDVHVRVVPSGPDFPDDHFYDFVLAAMLEARRRVWIVSPYFVPDETILRILGILARIGRDVRIVVPEHSERLLVDLARRSALRELARAGVHVHLYKGMLHSKMLLIDDDIAAVGSANMDMRSLLLNYEIATFIYSQEEVARLEEVINRWTHHSRQLPAKPRRARGFLVEMLENASRLLSPLL